MPTIDQKLQQLISQIWWYIATNHNQLCTITPSVDVYRILRKIVDSVPKKQQKITQIKPPTAKKPTSRDLKSRVKPS